MKNEVLSQALAQTVLNDKRDTWVWKLEKDGIYSSCSLFLFSHLLECKENRNYMTLFGKETTQKMVKFFPWELGHIIHVRTLMISRNKGPPG